MTRTARTFDPQVRIRARQIIAVTLASLALGSNAQAQQRPSRPSAPASAQSPDPQPTAAEAAFHRADINKDGKLSREEAAAVPAVAARFDEHDANKDGFLSLEEFLTGYTSG
jgi:Ca2+-binding EF-hand superfamily protein